VNESADVRVESVSLVLRESEKREYIAAVFKECCW